ncbi:group XVI phospholipase a2-like protein [Plakobranchus ocellatus]|uniref:Group XVI phospholipase a2-like protein n=1 Tax=Plakobranchus ocellatus TaxID=259542 RepID=A0AAV3ZY76_9GAST|nr:group XVI phospholipase a2-like protein [Plakobranchus ocellatus]
MSSFVSRRLQRTPIKAEEDLDDVAPGSLLEIDQGNYKHWAIYIGDRKVCHLTVEAVMGGPSFTASLACLKTNKGKILVQLFRDMLAGETPPVFVNNSRDSKWTPRSAEDIVTSALSYAGQKVRYDLVTFNCEHFANECRYGIKASLQVEDTADAARVGTVLLGVGAVALAFGKLIFGKR